MIINSVTGVVELSVDQITVLLKYVSKVRVVDIEKLDECLPLITARNELRDTLKELLETGA